MNNQIYQESQYKTAVLIGSFSRKISFYVVVIFYLIRRA